MMVHGCRGYSEQRALLERAKRAGVQPDASVYNVLLGNLRTEGRNGEVKSVLTEMRARRIEHDARTSAALARRPRQRARR